MSYLVQMLLPTTPTRRSRVNLETVKNELTALFGGVTMHLDAPAEGLWRDDGETEHDRIVVVEVMSDDVDRAWWAGYRVELQARFRQDEIVVRLLPMERL
ncbi:hypothetical protein SB748_13050 [Rhizobium sp. SIMBA_035]